MSPHDCQHEHATELTPTLILQLQTFAKSLSIEAGDIIRARRPKRVEVAATKSSSVDVVTEMDATIEAYLRQRIQEVRPEDSILGEEGASVEGSTGLTWVLDPIDGTVNYLYNFGSYAVSIGVVANSSDPQQWCNVVGAVHDVVANLTYFAGKGRGAWCEDQPLQVNQENNPAHLLLGTGFSYSAERRAKQGKVLAALIPQIRDIRRLGAAALDLCFVAAGRLDAYFEFGLNPWDLAAGQLIVEEAGGVTGGLHGKEAGQAMTVAGSKTAVEWLTKQLQDLEAELDS